MIQVANPIYDTVFKYMMEDLEVARNFIATLLKKTVVKVKMRRNEYSNIQKNGISIFRIDFAATVQEEDGSQHVVLIELQKAWVETEILRFRQYLGAQYANPENIYHLEDKKDDRNDYGIPLVSVYILGHKLERLKEPITYVRRNYLNYDNEPISLKEPDLFVESLSHDSIIVQIPYLTGQERNQAERMLNIFNQKNRLENNHQILDIDEAEYSDDPMLQRMLTRLFSAASDTKVRMNMNIEDEILTSLNNRDAKILERDRIIRQKDEQIVSAIKMLLSCNMPPEVIAQNLNVPVDYVISQM